MIVPKREKDISEIENKIIGLYALGMTIRDIAEQIKTLYGCEISEGLVSDITDKIIPKIEEWDAITPILKFSVKVRTVIYTTNAVESVNSRLIRKSVISSYRKNSKKWTGAIRDWGQIYGELRIMYGDRI